MPGQRREQPSVYWKTYVGLGTPNVRCTSERTGWDAPRAPLSIVRRSIRFCTRCRAGGGEADINDEGLLLSDAGEVVCRRFLCNQRFQTVTGRAIASLQLRTADHLVAVELILINKPRDRAGRIGLNGFCLLHFGGQSFHENGGLKRSDRAARHPKQRYHRADCDHGGPTF